MALYEAQLEAQPGGETVVLTTDDDFRIYRTAEAKTPDVLMPPA